MMVEQIPLGVLRTVTNSERNSNLESKTLFVGFIKVNSHLRPVAFTVTELRRPTQRAEDNKEDLPVLEVCESEENQLRDEVTGLKEKIIRLKNRSWWARLRNKD
jgi:hypothetical protein